MRREVASIAVATVLLQTLQVLYIVTDGVPLPPALEQVLHFLGYFMFEVVTARPECVVTIQYDAKLPAVLFGIPGALFGGYLLVLGFRRCCCCCHNEQPRGHFTLRGDVKRLAAALLANVYWIWLPLLSWSWSWLQCSENADGDMVLAFQQDVPCSLDGGRDYGWGWKDLFYSGIPGLLVYQLALPALMVAMARKPMLKFATVPYRAGCSRSWLAVELCVKTSLVLVKSFVPAKHASARGWAMLFLIVAYHLLLVWQQPFSEEVMLHADGALFYAFLASGATQLTLAAAALVFIDGASGTVGDGMEVLLIAIVCFWVALVLRLSWVYRPRFKPKSTLDAGTLEAKLERFHKHKQVGTKLQLQHRAVVASYGLLVLIQVALAAATGKGALVVLGLLLLFVPMLAWTTRKRLFGHLDALVLQESRLRDGAFVACMLENVSVAVGMAYYVQRRELGLEEDDESRGKFDPLRRWLPGRVVAITATHLEVEVDGQFEVGEGVSRTRRVPAEDVNVDFKQLLESGKRDLRCVQASRIDEAFWAAGSGKTNAKGLSEPAAPGDVDFFCSHSWHDDRHAKGARWEAFFDDFRARNGRDAKVWLDEIVLDQSNFKDSLKCLPVYLMACKQYLLLGGETWVNMLWCVWELYTLFALCESADDSDDAISRVVVETTDSRLVEKLAAFELKDAHCFDPNDEAKIRAAIAAGPGGAAGFEAVIRRLGRRLLASSEERQARSMTAAKEGHGGEEREDGAAKDTPKSARQIVPAIDGGEDEGEGREA